MEQGTTEQVIVENIDYMIDDLKVIQDAVKENKNMSRIDPLDLLSFIVVGIHAIYNDIAERYGLKEE